MEKFIILSLISIVSIILLEYFEIIYLKVPPDEPIELRIKQKNKISQNCIIKPNTEQFKKLSKLLKSKTLGWHKEFSSIRGQIDVSNSSFYVFFSGNQMVTDKDGQYSYPIDIEDYSFLNCTEQPNKTLEEK